MKLGIKFIIAILGLTMICAWYVNQTNIQKAEWLIGTWENKTSKGSVYETWRKDNNYEFSGKSYVLKEKDTVVFENIRLVQEQDGLHYIPVVKNQNDGLPVRFKSNSISETQLTFENKEHDFPQIISYTLITSDSLVAEISGMRNGQERKQTFAMKRIKY